jgi:2-dehydropantoate 2-reductase
MHYMILGAGAVGGTIGGRLHQHGHRVTLVARGDHHDAIRDGGLLLATPDGEHRLDVPVALSAAVLEPDTVLVLTVKSQDSAAVLESWADVPVRGGGVAGDRLPLVCAQNGVVNERLALRLFARVYAVCVWLPATYLTPGTVSAEGHPHSGVLHLGRYPGGVASERSSAASDAAGFSDETAERIAADLSGSGFVAPVREDVMRWKYGKLLANLGNGISALFGSADQELSGRLRAEGMAVLDAAGLAYTSREEEAAERAGRLQVVPVAGHRRGGGSTWQSLARGTGSVEVDYLNGEIVLLGREHGVPTPVNLAVQRAVRRAARAGIGAGEFQAEEFRALLA